jgi:hypothetical protein
LQQHTVIAANIMCADASDSNLPCLLHNPFAYRNIVSFILDGVCQHADMNCLDKPCSTQHANVMCNNKCMSHPCCMQYESARSKAENNNILREVIVNGIVAAKSGAAPDVQPLV